MIHKWVAKVRYWLARLRTRNNFSYRGLKLKVDEGVLNPTAFRASFTFASAALRQVGDRSGPVLELGCGCGLASVLLARAGFEVTAVDLNQKAVANTLANATANKLQLEVLCSDWDEQLGDRQFDYVITNPPFLARKPDRMMRALYAGDQLAVLQACLAAVNRRLAPQGQALILTSSLTGRADFLALLAANGLCVKSGSQSGNLNERLYIDIVGHTEPPIITGGHHSVVPNKRVGVREST